MSVIGYRLNLTDMPSLLYVEQYRLIQELRGGTGVVEVNFWKIFVFLPHDTGQIHPIPWPVIRASEKEIGDLIWESLNFLHFHTKGQRWILVPIYCFSSTYQNWKCQQIW